MPAKTKQLTTNLPAIYEWVKILWMPVGPLTDQLLQITDWNRAWI